MLGICKPWSRIQLHIAFYCNTDLYCFIPTNNLCVCFCELQLVNCSICIEDTKALLITEFSCSYPVIQYTVSLSCSVSVSLSCSVFHGEDDFSCLDFIGNQNMNLLMDFIKKGKKNLSVEIAEAYITCFCWQGSLK